MGEHKKKKKKNSRSSSSSSDSDHGKQFDKRLEEDRKKSKKEKKLEKQRMKEEETPEEKRARRLAKKLRKEQRRQESQSMLPDSIDYTNTNNPFNDVNLTQTFVWGKKLEREGKANLSQKEVERENRERIKRNLREMEELKRNREARMAASSAKERRWNWLREDMEVMQRDADRRAHSEWSRKDMEFQLEQAKVRSRLRIEQNRAKPIDLLARYINFGETEGEKKKDEDDYELEEPSSYLKGLKDNDYEDLIEDIKVYLAVTGQKHAQYWKDITVIVRDELNKYRDSMSDRPSVHTAVTKDVVGIFKGKSMSELETLETQMKRKVDGGGAGTDVSYWSSLLQQLSIHMARKRIKETHEEKLKERLRRIREEQMKEMEEAEEKEKKEEREERERREKKKMEEKKAMGGRSKKGTNTLQWLEEEEVDEQERENRWRSLSEEDTDKLALLLYENGGYEPNYGREDDVMPGIPVLDEEKDDEELTKQRAAKRNTPAGVSIDTGLDAAQKSIAMQGMDSSSEKIFGSEVKLDECKELWTDKYRPRKPRYLNRVQTGFDWNKYNQTHYDQDNPPPKIVQGYKFNIFYPDLLKKDEAPTFKLVACDDPDFAEIHFHAGPPYEDIAFKIVNREWDANQKFGYKCQFQNGVFQLWFQFKRYKYRR